MNYMVRRQVISYLNCAAGLSCSALKEWEEVLVPQKLLLPLNEVHGVDKNIKHSSRRLTGFQCVVSGYERAR